MDIRLLLIFSLATGSLCNDNFTRKHPPEDIRVSGCQGGWVKFICKNPCNSSFPMNRTKMIPNKTKNVTVVVVKNLQQKDNLTISTPNRLQKIQIVNCSQPQINHTASNKAPTTVGCGSLDFHAKENHTFFKETSAFDHEDVTMINKRANSTLNASGWFITFPEVTSEDQGTYWCVVQTHNFNWTYRKVLITVQAETSPEEDKFNRTVWIVTGALSVAVLLLTLVVVVMVLKYCKGRNDSPEQDITDDNVYEEIQHPNTGGAVTTVYATAEACKESLHYVRLDFGESPNSTKPKPSASHHEYSAVFTNQKRTVSSSEPGDVLQS